MFFLSTTQAVHAAIELWGAFFCLIAAGCVFMTRKMDAHGAKKLGMLLLCCALLMVSDAFAWMFRAQPDAAAFWIVRIANFAAFFFAFAMLPLAAAYITHIFERRTGRIGFPLIAAERALFAFGGLLLIANLVFPFMYAFSESTYYRLAFAFLPAVIGALGIILIAVVVFRNFGLLFPIEKAALAVSLVSPIVFAVVQMLHYGASLIYFAIVISCLLLFLSYEFTFMHYGIEMERQLAQERIRLLNKQMQPHFLFNCIATIRHLCLKNPQEAVDTINEFAGYMRGMTDLLNESDCVPATWEFDLVKHYVALEQKRFGERLQVDYQLDDADFKLPPFSVETLVENAVKHGLRSGRTDSGLITVTSRLEGNFHIVKIEDNGVGFDTSAIRQTAKSKPVGIQNTEERLRLMCGGSLTVQSVPGKGTLATITIPGGVK